MLWTGCQVWVGTNDAPQIWLLLTLEASRRQLLTRSRRLLQTKWVSGFGKGSLMISSRPSTGMKLGCAPTMRWILTTFSASAWLSCVRRCGCWLHPMLPMRLQW